MKVSVDTEVPWFAEYAFHSVLFVKVTTDADASWTKDAHTTVAITVEAILLFFIGNLDGKKTTELSLFIKALSEVLSSLQVPTDANQ